MARLQELYPHLSLRIRTIRTSGDRARRTPLRRLGGFGLFVKEVEEALLAGEVDLAVHSLKDLPTEPTPGLLLAAIPERGDVRDAFLAREGRPLAELPTGATIGTSSLRRAVQIRALRPDLEVVEIRGNLDTRLRKLKEGQVEGLVVAAAGLQRLDRLAEAVEIFPPDLLVPAPGQGALAIQVREGDEELRQLLAPLDHRESRLAVTAERAMLRALGGGCRVPVAAWGRVEGEELYLLGLVASPDGSQLLSADRRGPAEAAEAVGRELAERLLSLGAGAILAAGWP